MKEMSRLRKIGWSCAAIAAGTIVGVALSLGTDDLMRAAGLLPPLGQVPSEGSLVLATVYRTFYGVLGCYVTARLAPSRPMLHALLLGVFGLVATIAGVLVTWNKGPEFGPHWYPIALVLLTMPQSWAGGRLRELQIR